MGKGQRWYLDYCSSWTSSLFFCLSTLLLVFYTCSKWQCWEALEHVCLSLPPEGRGRHTVHPNNWVLKDIFKWPKCGLHLASQEIWASLKTSRRIYWEHVDPCTEKDGCLRGLPYRYIHGWPVTLSLSWANAKPGGFALGSAFPRTLVLPAVPGYILQWHLLLQCESRAAWELHENMAEKYREHLQCSTSVSGGLPVRQIQWFKDLFLIFFILR